jgi:hypothetical protein
MNEKYHYGEEAMNSAIRHGVTVRGREDEEKKLREKVAEKEIENLEITLIPEEIKDNILKIMNRCNESNVVDTIKQIQKIDTQYKSKYPELLNGFIGPKLIEISLSPERVKKLEMDALAKGFLNEKIDAPKQDPLNDVWGHIFDLPVKLKQRKIRK